MIYFCSSVIQHINLLSLIKVTKRTDLYFFKSLIKALSKLSFICTFWWARTKVFCLTKGTKHQHYLSNKNGWKTESKSWKSITSQVLVVTNRFSMSHMFKTFIIMLINIYTHFTHSTIHIQKSLTWDRHFCLSLEANKLGWKTRTQACKTKEK